VPMLVSARANVAKKGFENMPHPNAPSGRF
jgi:hypothetical protein